MSVFVSHDRLFLMHREQTWQSSSVRQNPLILYYKLWVTAVRRRETAPHDASCHWIFLSVSLGQTRTDILRQHSMRYAVKCRIVYSLIKLAEVIDTRVIVAVSSMYCTSVRVLRCAVDWEALRCAAVSAFRDDVRRDVASLLGSPTRNLAPLLHHSARYSSQLLIPFPHYGALKLSKHTVC